MMMMMMMMVIIITIIITTPYSYSSHGRASHAIDALQTQHNIAHVWLKCDLSSPLVQFLSPDGSAIYDLVAVLIHRGPSAYSGHYIAHIKHWKTDAWFKFNDEEIEKMSGKNLQLGNEEEIQGAVPLALLILPLLL